MSRPILALCLCLITMPAVHAELPPGSYDKLRREADEAVILHITSVSIRANGTYKEVTIQAQIVRVGRSLSGLERGDTITVKYEVSTVPFPGPRPVPILRKNEVYPAFLNKSGNSYVPAAFGESFNSKPETPR